jgi:flagellar protein FliS
MFASAANSSMFQRQAGAYKQVHLNTGVDGASPHGLVVMLFEGLTDALAQARGAMRSGNIEQKGRAIGRAVGIVTEGLRGRLNLQEGGKLAADLDELYAYITIRLIHANLRNDESALDECNRLLEPVRMAWSQIADKQPVAAS